MPRGICDSENLSEAISVRQPANVAWRAYRHVCASSTQILSELGIKGTRARAANKKSE
jgi:hypothetical protein